MSNFDLNDFLNVSSVPHPATGFVPVFSEFLSNFNPVTLTSFHRSRQRNASVGGAPTSRHLVGCAVDFACPNDVFSYIDSQCKVLKASKTTRSFLFDNSLFYIQYYPKRFFYHLQINSYEKK